MNEKRGYWYLLSGLALGFGLGLLLSWVLLPVQFTDTTPASLRADFKDDYRLLIASAYAANADLPRAQARLETLSEGDPIRTLGDQSQRMLENSFPVEAVQGLADLSSALQAQPSSTSTPEIQLTASPPASMTPLPSPTIPTFTPIVPTSTVTASISPSPSMRPSITTSPTITLAATATHTPKPISTLASRATQTITPTPGAPYQLANKTTFCEPDQPGLLMIYITRKGGKPAAGVELVITWVNTEEHFFTGLKPEVGYGYADFSMTPNIEYALSLPEGGLRITGLTTPRCTAGYPGGIRLDLKQP